MCVWSDRESQLESDRNSQRDRHGAQTASKEELSLRVESNVRQTVRRQKTEKPEEGDESERERKAKNWGQSEFVCVCVCVCVSV